MIAPVIGGVIDRIILITFYVGCDFGTIAKDSITLYLQVMRR